VGERADDATSADHSEVPLSGVCENRAMPSDRPSRRARRGPLARARARPRAVCVVRGPRRHPVRALAV